LTTKRKEKTYTIAELEKLFPNTAEANKLLEQYDIGHIGQTDLVNHLVKIIYLDEQRKNVE
jgi:hypothetical protein